MDILMNFTLTRHASETLETKHKELLSMNVGEVTLPLLRAFIRTGCVPMLARNRSSSLGYDILHQVVGLSPMQIVYFTRKFPDIIHQQGSNLLLNIRHLSHLGFHMQDVWKIPLIIMHHPDVLRHQTLLLSDTIQRLASVNQAILYNNRNPYIFADDKIRTKILNIMQYEIEKKHDFQYPVQFYV